jgi:ATP-dependent RNA helicase SUPV3L1/SUV3
MMSILGCSADELGHVLRALGFRAERRPMVVTAAIEPATVASAAAPEAGAIEAAGPAEAGIDQSPAPQGDAPAGDATQPSPLSAEQAGPAEEEIWRPRRRNRAFDSETTKAHQQQEEIRSKKSGLRPHENRSRSARPRRQREAHKQRREDRPRAQLASVTPTKAAFDPDSPFAALSSLKAAMDKRTPE